MNVVRSIMAVTLSMLVLLASSSFFVGIHVCSETVKGVAFLEKADGCGHQAMPPCHLKMMEGCCEDSQLAHEASDFNVSTSIEIQAPVLFAVTFQPVLGDAVIVQPTNKSKPVYLFSSPVRTGHDIILSTHSLLI